jgi:hypothetical protein
LRKWKTLKAAHSIGVVDEDADGKPLFTVSAPNINDVATADKANRLLPNINWTATVAGAIENVDINGVLTL